MMTLRWIGFLSVLVFLPASWASAETITDAVSDPNETVSSSFGGWLDLRPTWMLEERSLQGENEVAVEYRFRTDRGTGYTQEFHATLFEPETVETKRSVFFLGDGYFWGNFAGILQWRRLTVSYEPRVYLPTYAPEREAGLILATRQYLKLEFAFNETVSAFLWEVPVLPLYGAGGTSESLVDEVGDPYRLHHSNARFENRMEAGLNLTLLSEKIKIRLPLIVQSLRMHDYHPEAENNDQWAHILWTYPEVLVQVGENSVLGFAYYSGTLIDEKFTQFAENGFSEGAFQVVLQQSI